MIGVLGGTFDPVHYGHLRPALEVMQRCGLDELRLLPCGVPAHRAPPLASAAQRLAMLQRAIAGQPGFIIDTRELERPGPSYMVPTLLSLHQSYPDDTLCLVLGEDAYHGLPSWHQWQRLFELSHLLVMQRPGSPLQHSTELAGRERRHRIADAGALRQMPAGGVLHCAVTQLGISASTIRHMFEQGERPRYLMPDPVIEYITSQGLYGSHGRVV
ncbi:MAG: nicotinate-nucleotide adenylyltransferase [Gammaproteobacteria bacterium]|nr:nicotinate-nucleotide adenylyltransferase [Gammaproteobacteria bacterium]